MTADYCSIEAAVNGYIVTLHRKQGAEPLRTKESQWIAATEEDLYAIIKTIFPSRLGKRKDGEA